MTQKLVVDLNDLQRLDWDDLVCMDQGPETDHGVVQISRSSFIQKQKCILLLSFNEIECSKSLNVSACNTDVL